MNVCTFAHYLYIDLTFSVWSEENFVSTRMRLVDSVTLSALSQSNMQFSTVGVWKLSENDVTLMI